ncbi:MAG: tetratricopeptide repeat protein [candidate division NC10 bacterium]|nr:tetratricopeptide repeat protein [candidate division NC10 bacterium]
MKRFGILWGGIFVVALAGSIFIGRGLEARGETRRLSEESLYIPSATFLRYASLGHQTMVADLMWIRTVQYFGREIERRRELNQPRDSKERYKFLYPLLDLTVSLDPQFVRAYRFGGILLTVVKRYDEAIALYAKGYAANPDRWEMPHDLGRLYYLDLKDHEKALYWWKIANDLPGRPGYIPRFVPRLYAQTGQKEIAIELWLEMLEASDSKTVRAIILLELQKLGVTISE